MEQAFSDHSDSGEANQDHDPRGRFRDFRRGHHAQRVVTRLQETGRQGERNHFIAENLRVQVTHAEILTILFRFGDQIPLGIGVTLKVGEVRIFCVELERDLPILRAFAFVVKYHSFAHLS